MRLKAGLPAAGRQSHWACEVRRGVDKQNMAQTHLQPYQAALKRKEILPRAMARTHLGDTVLSDIRQTPKTDG